MIMAKTLKDYEYYRTDLGVLYCGDCLEIMQLITEPVELVLTDPPYGLTWKSTNLFNNKSIGVVCTELQDTQKWDIKPCKEIFDLLKLKSKEQIIWGGNFFCDFLGSFKSPIIWDKQTGNNNYADGEMAWTSFKTGTLRILHHQWCGAFKDSERGTKNVHPTQKPVFVMQYCLNLYSKENDLILDPFFGSGTTGLACEKLNRRWIGIEILPKYAERAKRRIEIEARQLKLFR
jgi:DNA modification methylase